MSNFKFGDGDFGTLEGLVPDKNDPELDNFLTRVGQISSIISGLASNDQKDQERAIRQADILLHDGSGDGTFDHGDPTYRIKSDRTVINPAKAASEEGDMPQEAFMKMVEKDAADRAKDRKERKRKSDEFRAKGNLAFKNEKFAEALDNYNKAISLVKDSPCLYTNRALTYIRIGIHSKAVEDCDQALYINDDLIKPRLLKVRAYFNMAEPELAHQTLREAKERFPAQDKMIKEYEKDIFEMKMEQHLRTKSTKDTGKDGKNGKEVPFQPDAEEIWRKAARHELGQEEDIEETGTLSSQEPSELTI